MQAQGMLRMSVPIYRRRNCGGMEAMGFKPENGAIDDYIATSQLIAVTFVLICLFIY